MSSWLRVSSNPEPLTFLRRMCETTSRDGYIGLITVVLRSGQRRASCVIWLMSDATGGSLVEESTAGLPQLLLPLVGSDRPNARLLTRLMLITLA